MTARDLFISYYLSIVDSSVKWECEIRLLSYSPSVNVTVLPVIEEWQGNHYHICHSHAGSDYCRYELMSGSPLLSSPSVQPLIIIRPMWQMKQACSCQEDVCIPAQESNYEKVKNYISVKQDVFLPNLENTTELANVPKWLSLRDHNYCAWGKQGFIIKSSSKWAMAIRRWCEIMTPIWSII